MKNTLKILSIFLVGLAVVLTSCNRENYPFPTDIERITMLQLTQTAGPTLIEQITPPETVFRFTLGLAEFGGNYPIEKVEVFVVRNHRVIYRFDTLGFNIVAGDTIHTIDTVPLFPQPGLIRTFTNHQFSLESPTAFEVTMQELVDLTGGDPQGMGETFLIYYNLQMQNGARFVGWHRQLGIISARAWIDLRITGHVLRNVVCRVLTIDHLTGTWQYTTTWGNGPWFGGNGILDAVACPDNVPGSPEVAIILTMRESTWVNNGWNRPIRFVLNLNTLAFTSARQRVIDRVTTDSPNADWPWTWPWSAAWTNVELWAGSGSFDDCLYPAIQMRFTANVTNYPNNSGWSGAVHTFTRTEPARH